METHEAIKAIRIELGVSQVVLAREIHVGFATVNRWENQKSKPNRIARHAIIELCKKKKINKILVETFENIK